MHPELSGLLSYSSIHYIIAVCGKLTNRKVFLEAAFQGFPVGQSLLLVCPPVIDVKLIPKCQAGSGPVHIQCCMGRGRHHLSAHGNIAFSFPEKRWIISKGYLVTPKRECICIHHDARIHSNFRATTVKIYNYQKQVKITGQGKKNPNYRAGRRCWE